MREVDFSNFNPDKKKGGGNGISFLRFESGKTYKIRPFGSCVEFYKLFIAKGKPSVIVDPGDKDEAARILSEATGREIRPSYRNAMFVIDREDGGKIKILEGGFQIFESFANWSASSGVKPGAGQAGDWTIKVEGEGVGGSNPRKYSPSYLGPSVFSEEEKKMISALKAADKLKLGNYLKETALTDVLSAAGLEEAAPVAAQPVAATAAAGGSDEFDF